MFCVRGRSAAGLGPRDARCCVFSEAGQSGARIASSSFFAMSCSVLFSSYFVCDEYMLTDSTTQNCLLELNHLEKVMGE